MACLRPINGAVHEVGHHRDHLVDVTDELSGRISLSVKGKVRSVWVIVDREGYMVTRRNAKVRWCIEGGRGTETKGDKDGARV